MARTPLTKSFSAEPAFAATNFTYDLPKTTHQRSDSRMTYRKKLIEVALPLDAINTASVREKSIRHGHPSTLHLWWARRPLAACRAVLFASLVDDPSEHPEEFPTEQEQEQERLRLFQLIEELVKWENSNNKDVLARAKAEIYKSTGGNPPPVLDPFSGRAISHLRRCR
jgi:putative DNA methylase